MKSYLHIITGLNFTLIFTLIFTYNNWFKFNKWGIMMRVKYCVELLLYCTSKGEIARLPVCYTYGRSWTKAHKARALDAKSY